MQPRSGSAPLRLHQRLRAETAIPEPLTLKERRALRDHLDEERTRAEHAYIGSMIVLTEGQQRVVDAVVRRVDRTAIAPPGAQRAVYVRGPASAGKSTAVDVAARQVYRALCDEAMLADPDLPQIDGPDGRFDYRPVVHVTLRAAAQRGAVSSQLLEALGFPGTSGRTVAATTGFVIRAAAEAGTRLIIIDDVDKLALNRRDADDIADHIKGLNTELGQLGIAFTYIEKRDPADAGAPSLLDDTQLGRRALMHELTELVIDPASDTITAADKAWARQLQQWEHALQPALPALQDGDLLQCGRALWAHTSGLAGQVGPALRELAHDAIDNRTYRITEQDIDRLPPAMDSVEYHRRAIEEIKAYRR